MKHEARNIFIKLSAVWIFGCGVVFAVNNTTLESSYLGDGLFKYEMTVHHDPFFALERNSFGVSFPGLIDVVEHTPGWTFNNQTNSFVLEYPEGLFCIPRPYSAYCIVRSAYTNYCVNSFDNARVIISGDIVPLKDSFGTQYSGVVSMNIVFYSFMNALVPCLKEDADGASPIFTHDFEMIPDVRIDGVLNLNNEANGLEFSWKEDSTVLIQASTNLQDWVDIQYALGSPPSTNWIAPEPLETYGKFFRVLLAARGHRPELLGAAAPQMAAMSLVETQTTPSFRLTGIHRGKMTVQIDTEPDSRYAVSVKQTGSKQIFKIIECTAEGLEIRVDIDMTGFPASAYIDVVELK